jgi:hypothetical protein
MELSHAMVISLPAVVVLVEIMELLAVAVVLMVLAE